MRRSFALLIAFLACLLAAPAVAGPPPGGRPDPRQMSGIPRVDPQLAAGTITVRVLEGGFDAPTVGAEVTLKLTKGHTVETKTAKTVAEGRATFAGLDAFIGGTAVASVKFGDETVTSMSITLAPASGSRVMLVKGAAASPQVGGPAPGPGDSPHGGASDVPLPGAPFPLKDRPAGSLIVGALDLSKKAPIEGIDVILQIRDPEAGEDVAPITRKVTTDENGRAKFDGLLPPEVPEKAEITVLASLAEGEPPARSQTFTMPAEGGLAVVLTAGISDTADGAGAGAGAGEAPAQPGLTPIPPPQMDPSLKAGTVKVLLLDGRDRPVVDHTVTVVRKDVSGQELRFRGTTGKDGIATITEVALNPESFYFVGVVYDHGPYQSGFFQLPDTMGARVPMRVFATTTDRSRIKSAVQYEFRALENDQVQVIQLYELFVDGTEAFWPGEGNELRIEGMPGAKHLQVLPRSEGLLDQPSDSAPYARLIEPIPPGDVEHLSIAYVLEHDGSIDLSWDAPFQLIQGAAVVEPPIVVRDANGKELPRDEAPHAQTEDGRPLAVYQLPVGDAAGGSNHVQLEVTDLASRDRWPQRTALLGAVVLIVLVFVAFLVRPRLGVRDSLVARRDALLGELRSLGPNAPAAEREAIVTALDQVYRKLEALEPSAPAEPAGPRAT